MEKRLLAVEKSLSELQARISSIESNVELANRSVSGTLIDMSFLKKRSEEILKKVNSRALNLAEVQSYYIEQVLELKKDLARIEALINGE